MAEREGDQTKLSVRVEQHDKGPVFFVEGRMDAGNASMLEDAVRIRLEAGQRTMSFDLTELEYIASAGLRVLLMAARECESRGGKSVYYGLSEKIAEIFEVSGFDKVLNVIANRDEEKTMTTDNI